MKAYLVEYIRDAAMWKKVNQIAIDCNAVYDFVKLLGYKRLENRNGNEVYFKREAYDQCSEIIIDK